MAASRIFAVWPGTKDPIYGRESKGILRFLGSLQAAADETGDVLCVLSRPR
jgi:hypothetical protein